MCSPQNDTSDLTVIIVSYNDGHWLQPCLTSLRARTGDARVDVVLVDNGTDGAGAMAAERFPEVRVVTTENRGFGHGNNQGLMASSGPYVLFLNPDTELVDGTLADLVRAMDERPGVGLVGVRQVTADGALWPTIRYFPSFPRALGDALASERWPRRFRWSGERELSPALYEQETECDWTSGSFMLARREALISAGLFDERFFIYSEEPDLCLRMKRAGWSIRHMPSMTIVHHAGKAGMQPKMIAQDVFTRRQYANKHFTAAHRAAYLTAIGSRYALRAAAVRGFQSPERAAARAAVRTLLGTSEAPYRRPPETALTAWNTGAR
jgi:N-acetylglucosaminyl-diphospho-decaprenol L-rhamnosyltransferase